jgi:hypothetical protein
MNGRQRRSDVRTRIREAEKAKHWGELAGILDDADRNDIATLKPIIPDLIRHHEWIIRASTLEAIGRSHLHSFANRVKARLRDRNRIVRSYALMAYYDLLGAKALPMIDVLCTSQDMRVRVTALALRYIDTHDSHALEALRRILTRKNCSYFHRSAVMRMFDYYFDSHPPTSVVALYEDVLPDVPKSSGLAKDMKKLLGGNWRRGKPGTKTGE